MSIIDKLAATQHFSDIEFLNTLVSLFVALLLGTVIGAERQYRQRTAGLRTNALVALGAAAFVDLAMQLAGNDGATRVLAYIASGVGFLGAGVIMKDGANVRGLNTAATIWCSAVIGAYAGADHPLGALAMCCFVLIGNMFLRPLVNYIERAPIDESAAELTIEVRVCTTEVKRNDVRELLLEGLETATYPLRDIREIFREDEVELIATLATTSARAQDLDRLTTSLTQAPGVVHATWTSRAAE